MARNPTPKPETGGRGPDWRVRLLYGAGALLVFGVGLLIGSLITDRGRAPAGAPIAASVPTGGAEREIASTAEERRAIPLSQAFRSPLTTPSPVPSQEQPTLRAEPSLDNPTRGRSEDVPQIQSGTRTDEIASAPSLPPVPAKPMIAIVIDDMGVARARSARAAALPGPLTLAYLPYADDLAAQTAAARARGHELLVHMPMEPLDADIDPGPYALLSGVDRVTLLDILTWNLSRFEGYVGVNNHMGSRFTADAAGMEMVMTELRRRGLFFLDSVTSPDSVALSLAREIGVPASRRDVFLDHVDDTAAIEKALGRLLAVARERGTAVAIGHPRASTIAVLETWLGGPEADDYRLVPLSTIVRARLSGDPRLAALKP